MKILMTIFILLMTSVLFGQGFKSADTNCLAIEKLKYQILDSNTVNAIEFKLTNSKYDNILTYNSKEHIRLAYYKGDKSKWISFEVPFTEATNDFNFVLPASNKGNLLIVKGVTSKSEIRSRSEFRQHTYIMLIINIDNEPTIIFDASYGCDEAVIPYDGAKETNYSYKKHERIMTITDYGLIISTPDNNEPTPDGCKLSDIEDGTYLFNGIGLIKEK